MTQLDRRIDKLEAAATDIEKLLLLFVSWVRTESTPPRRLRADWKGERFNQNPGESAEMFKDRVRDAVNRNRPAGNCAAVLFLDEVDARL